MILILLISIAIMAYLGYRLRKSMRETKNLRNSAQQPETQRLESSEGWFKMKNIFLCITLDDLVTKLSYYKNSYWE